MKNDAQISPFPTPLLVPLFCRGGHFTSQTGVAIPLRNKNVPESVPEYEPNVLPELSCSKNDYIADLIIRFSVGLSLFLIGEAFREDSSPLCQGRGTPLFSVLILPLIIKSAI